MPSNPDSKPRGMRVFLGCLPDESTRQRWLEIQSMDGWSGRAVLPRNLHLTLVFIGTVSRELLAPLIDVARSAEIPGTPLVLNKTGWFPKPRVGWLGSSEVVPDAWTRLIDELRAGLGANAFAFDRRAWVPHVTLYRQMRTAPPTMASRLSEEPLRWRPERVELLESTHDQDGLVYRPLR